MNALWRAANYACACVGRLRGSGTHFEKRTYLDVASSKMKLLNVMAAITCRKHVPITHLIAQTGQPSNNGYATRIRSLKLNWINSAVVLIPRSSITRYLWNAMVLGVTLRISAASFIDFPSANTWITCR